MEQENVILLDVKKVVTKVFQLSVFVALAVMAPYFLNQLVTGSIVNALLFISVSILGLESAFLLCLIPSLISIYTGLLPLALAPMIPFIMTGNALLVLIFSKFSKRNFWAGAVPAILVKYIFIWSVGMLLANSVLHGISKTVLLMISWPQLTTAIAGACIAYCALKLTSVFGRR
jgi:hypothetical protein